MLYFNADVVVKEKLRSDQVVETEGFTVPSNKFGDIQKSTKTTIPFVKNNEFDYANLIKWLGSDSEKYVWIVYVLVVSFCDHCSFQRGEFNRWY